MVRSEVSRESAEVVSETIRDERVQFSAQEFSKELLNQLLNDKDIEKLVAKRVMQLLVDIQDDIGALLVKIILTDQCVEGVNRLADRLVEYLCASTTIQQKVGGLLVDAICLQSSRDASAAWAVDLVLREDVTIGFRDLVVAALQMDAVVSEAQNLASSVLNQVLQDPEVVAEAKRTLNETLQDSELRATAKETLWGVVMPWGSRPAASSIPKAIRSIDELSSLDTSTSEEKQMLKSLQARIKAQPTSAPDSTVGAETPTSAAISSGSESAAPPANMQSEEAARLAEQVLIASDDSLAAAYKSATQT